MELGRAGAIAVVAAVSGVEAVVKILPDNKVPARQATTAPLPFGRKEYLEFGLSKTATHKQLWPQVKAKQLRLRGGHSEARYGDPRGEREARGDAEGVRKEGRCYCVTNPLKKPTSFTTI